MDQHLKDDININTLQKNLSQAREELAILYDISNAMRTTLELNHILHIILTGVTSHTGFGFNRAILFLINQKERTFEVRMAIGPQSGEEAARIWQHIEIEKKDLDDLIAQYQTSQNPDTSFYQSIKHLRISLHSPEGGLLARVFETGSPLHIHHTDIHKYREDPLLKVFSSHELVIMPLKAKDKVNGIIIADNLYTQKPITSDDLKIFTMFTNQAGLAIENSQLYEIVVHKGHTDSLTSLWNHGFFQSTFLKEIDKAKHNHSPLNLLMIDIDNFKLLNDSLGHQNGDIVLTHMAKLLKELSRDKDYVCRYGGEEFAIILPETNHIQAFEIAERIREKMASTTFPINSHQQPVTLTISIGFAGIPDDADNKEELILKADKAMYTAKFIGKNKTCPANSQID